jgi:predicted histidine transporter YuiF (NhaC family)
MRTKVLSSVLLASICATNVHALSSIDVAKVVAGLVEGIILKSDLPEMEHCIESTNNLA